MSYNLEASVKTRYGVTRNIKRENGGRQGSRLTSRLFSRQMDMLSEKFVTGEICRSLGTIENRDDPDIGCLEWVDDALTLTIGVENTKNVLNKVDEFAKENKLEWGLQKCQVMQVGKKAKCPEKWNLGSDVIENTTAYKYLGDELTSNCKNDKNILQRDNRVCALVRQINTAAFIRCHEGHRDPRNPFTV